LAAYVSADVIYAWDSIQTTHSKHEAILKNGSCMQCLAGNTNPTFILGGHKQCMVHIGMSSAGFQHTVTVTFPSTILNRLILGLSSHYY